MILPRPNKQQIAGAFRDLAFISGLGFVTWGISMIHVPSAVIFGGVALTAVAYFSSESDDEPPRQHSA